MKLSSSANLGDCMWCLQMLRRIGGQHQVYCKPEYVAELAPLMEDTQVTVHPLDQWDGTGEDFWIANGRFESSGVIYRNQVEILEYVAGFMNHLAGSLGHPVPIYNSTEDMLWDGPLIGPPKVCGIVDCLIVSSDPLSGQCPQYSRSELWEKVVVPMQAKYGNSVIATNYVDGTPAGYTLAEIGAISTMAKRIICVATGPSWTCHNIWNKSTPRIVILDPMRLNYGPNVGPLYHVANATECEAKARELGWI